MDHLTTFTAMIRILLADDHTIFRAGVCALIAPEEDIEVVAEITNTTDLTRLMDDVRADIMMIDVAFENHRGIEVTKTLKTTYPQLHIIGFSMVGEKEHAIDMLKAGANGFLLRNVSKKDMLEAIRSVAVGNSYLCQEASLILLEQLNLATKKPSTLKGEALTPRETEVLQLIAKEYSNPEIAEKLFISLRTVDTHRRHLLDKTEAKNTAGLVKYAFYHGMLPWSLPQ